MPLESLRHLDRLAETKNVSILLLRALVRESVNDLTGAFSDLQSKNLSPHFMIIKARILAKLGFGDKAIALLQEVLTKVDQEIRPTLAEEALGIGGRRFDLRLMGIGLKKNQVSMSAPRNVGAILAHLGALAELDERDLQVFSGQLGSRELSRYRELKTIDELRHILDAGPQITAIRKAIFGIRGWLSFDEARLLAALSSRVPRQLAIVELGSFFGRSTVALSCGLKDIGVARIHAVDPHKGLAGIFEGSTLDPFLKNLESRRVGRKVRVHVSTSVTCARSWNGGRIGMLFIDARHDTDSVRSDFEAWFPAMTSTCYVAFHDVTQPGPNAVVRDLLYSRELRPLGLRDSTFVFQVSSSRLEPHRTRLADEWDKYLQSLHADYDTWVELQRSKLRLETLQLFEDATRQRRHLTQPSCAD